VPEEPPLPGPGRSGVPVTPGFLPCQQVLSWCGTFASVEFPHLGTVRRPVYWAPGWRARFASVTIT